MFDIGGERVQASEIGAFNSLRGDAIGATRQKEAEGAGPNPGWTLLGYRQECGGMVDVGRFSAAAVDGKKLPMYDRNNFQRDTAIGAWKRRWALLRKRSCFSLRAGGVILPRIARRYCCENGG